MPGARDGYFTTYYAFNKIILDGITVKFDIQVDGRTITQSILLHDDIPGYNLLTLEFLLLPVNDDKDVILEEENPEIYVHLENILVHMINAQDVAIFKSQKDYIRNKQKLSEYICYAQLWQVLSVIFSYVAFTCNIILVITLIIFFIRYQKMMQAMLMAFIYFPRPILKESVRIETCCCTFKRMISDWTNTEVTGISGIRIEMPNKAKILIFTDSDLTHITDDHFEIKLVA